MVHTPLYISVKPEWPLEEYEEKRILSALSLQQQNITWPTEEESDSVSPLATSPSSINSNCYFTDKSPFQLNGLIRRQSLSNSLRCSICQRRFHSQGNLSNHTQLYH